uniref:FGENESH: predicted gene_15.120 protein n=1 Tax=Rhodotorula toruloides TaxID=5286 RepID=A0A0K3CPS0_RHOTO
MTAPATSERPSPASRLPTELLFRILEWMPIQYAEEVREDLVAWTITSSCPGLREMSLVCRSWREAAQSILFRSIDLARRYQVCGFIEAAKARPDLAYKCQSARIGMAYGTPEWHASEQDQQELSDRFVDALELVPSLRNLVLRTLMRDSHDRLMHTLERLPLSSFLLKMYDATEEFDGRALMFTPAEIYRAIALPTYAFELNWRPHWDPSKTDYALPPDLSTRIQRLSVTVNSPPGFQRILRMVDKSLTSFSVYTEHPFDAQGVVAHFSALTGLRELRFESNMPAPVVKHNRWFADVIPALKRLERLSVSEQAAPPCFIRSLPPSVKLVEYIYWDRRPDTIVDSLVEILEEQGEGYKFGLDEFVLTVDEEAFGDTVDEETVEDLTDAFGKLGVKFRVGFDVANIPEMQFELVGRVREVLGREGRTTVGSLAEWVPASLLARLAPSLPSKSEAFHLSLATFSPSSSSRIIPFRSTLQGRPPVALGREIRPSENEDDGVDVGFEKFLRGEKWGFGESEGAKEGENGVRELRGVDPKDVKELVVFTADRIQPFLNSLSTYSSAATVGMLGTSTPFHSPSHAPFSLFYGAEEASTGAVGVAIVRDSAGEEKQPRLDYGGLQPLGEPYEVTSSQGNIVLSLSSQNAARLLLSAVNDLFGTSASNLSAAQRNQEKEKEFFVAVYEGKPEARHVSRIMAGDPSRGAMSVETEEDVKKGYYVVFLHHPSEPTPLASLPPRNTLTFLSIPASNIPPHFSSSETPAKGDVIVLDSFIGASENGVVVKRRGEKARVCAIEGTSVGLE